MRFNPIPSNTAISLFQALLTARGFQLQPALDQAVQAVGVMAIDPELHRLVPASSLNYLASLRLRGERVFPIPSLIRHAPQLIGYYRMLLGVSKKDFSQANKLGSAHGQPRNVAIQSLERWTPMLKTFVRRWCYLLLNLSKLRNY